MLWGASDKWLNHGEEIEKAQKAAIHVRLGDFKKTVWGALPNSYYQRAVVALLEGGVQEIDCYSDDIEDAKSIFGNLISEVNMIFPEENTSLNPLELLWVLSSYKYFASSNSSLSWWASYLNRNKDRTIYCPWGENLMMKEWVRI